MNFTDVKITRAVIDLDAVAHNYRLAKEVCENKRICAIIKADAYGHGAAPVAKCLEKEGCDFFATATVDEALRLRENGVKGTVLILGYVLSCYLESAISNGISLAADTYEHLESILKAANGRKVRVHINLDTGMNRTGFPAKDEALCDELMRAASLIKNNENLVFEGLFSHLAVADDDDGEAFSNIQYERFLNTAEKLEKEGLVPEIKHICNSAGLRKYSDRMGLDAVRCGISLYGCERAGLDYKPAMDFVTTVVNVHTMKKGEQVGYGLSFTAPKDMKIAVIGAGYADGLKRCIAENGGYVLIHGKKAPFVGRICMDMAMVDITDIPDVKVEDDAVIFGYSEGVHLSADEVAVFAGTISYEIICAVSARVPRVYK